MQVQQMTDAEARRCALRRPRRHAANCRRARFTATVTSLGISVFLLASPLQAEQFFRYTDDNGVVHFTDRPPQAQDYEQSDLPDAPMIGTVQTRVEDIRPRAYQGQGVFRSTGSSSRKAVKQFVRNAQKYTPRSQPHTGHSASSVSKHHSSHQIYTR